MRFKEFSDVGHVINDEIGNVDSSSKKMMVKVEMVDFVAFMTQRG